MIEFVFKDINAARVVATTDHENINSQRLMQKLGMKMFVNKTGEPFWYRVFGLLENPSLRQAE
jgi:hypothetical protein